MKEEIERSFDKRIRWSFFLCFLGWTKLSRPNFITDKNGRTKKTINGSIFTTTRKESIWMTQEEINTYMMALPYDAMGDFSVFREEKHRESQADSEKASQKK